MAALAVAFVIIEEDDALKPLAQTFDHFPNELMH
jgi:hypothetical protein